MDASAILIADRLSKSYTSAGQPLLVLDAVSFALQAGAACAVVGPSGSGKSTLLGLCAGLERPTSGKVTLNGADLNALDEDRRAALRAHSVGFVFQTFRLLPTLTALENVMVPLELLGGAGAARRAAGLLERVGLGGRLSHYPAQLSGGEQQRVALARAFVNQPRILFADEPTGNLDRRTSQAVADLLFALNRDAGTTLVLVTHDLELARRTGRVIELKDGALAADSPAGSAARA